MQGDRDTVGRRHFLRLVTGATLGATVAGSSLLAGCGGGGTQEGGGDDGGQAVVPPDTRTASLQAVQDFVNSVAGESRDTRLARIAEFLKGRTEFEQSGTDEDGVWAIYPDGVPLMILDNRQPDPSVRSIAPPTVTRRTDVPKSRQARLLFTLPAGFSSELPNIRPYLENNGYEVIVDPGTVASLRAVAGDGIFYMGAHGGRCRVSQRDALGNLVRDGAGLIISTTTFGAWTSSPVDPANPNEHLADLRAGRLGFGTVSGTAPVAGAALAGLFYVFTDAFVQNYMNFGKDALVWFSACHSNSALIAQPFVAACHAKGASVYVGWNSTVSDAAVLVTDRFIFTRLTGSDPAIPGENPPQRAFDYEPVWEDLRKKNLHLHPNGFGGTTEIRFSAAASNFALLVPAIKYVLINEPGEEAILRGKFGNPDPGERKVMVGGTEAPIVEWTEERIRVTIPQTGPGSAGDVQVVVREHKSNIRRITAWDLNSRFRWTDVTHPELVVQGPMKLRYRADIGTYREKPGEAPKEVLRTAVGTPDSQIALTASGTAHEGTDTTITWSKSQTFASALGGPGETFILANYLLIDTFLQKAQLALAFGAFTPPFLMTIVTRDRTVETGFATAFGLLNGVVEFPNPVEHPNAPPIPLPALDLSIDSQFGIAAGTHSPPEMPFLHLEWDAAPAQFPPDPRAARSAPARR